MKSYKQKIKRRKNTQKKILKLLLCVFVLTVFSNIMIDFMRFPECYISTWKYQLKNDLAAGDQKAMKYYQENYINRGRILYDNEVK